MRYIKWGLISLIVFTVVAFFHYSLPSRDIVRVVNTDVKRMDVGRGGWWWAEPDAGTSAHVNRDVRFINAVWPSGSPRVLPQRGYRLGVPALPEIRLLQPDGAGSGLVLEPAEPGLGRGHSLWLAHQIVVDVPECDQSAQGRWAE